jgi:hypothetical protein
LKFIEVSLTFLSDANDVSLKLKDKEVIASLFCQFSHHSCVEIIESITKVRDKQTCPLDKIKVKLYPKFQI